MRTVPPKFPLPDRDGLLQLVDDESAAFEGGLAVLAAHGYDDRGVADGEVAGAVVEGYGVEAELCPGGDGDLAHLADGHGSVGLEFKVGDGLAEVKIADGADEEAASAAGGVGHELPAVVQRQRLTAQQDINVGIGISHRPRGG